VQLTVELPTDESLGVFRKQLRAAIHRVRRSTRQAKQLLLNSSQRVESDQPEPERRIVNKPR
jgi:hypothetical protein